jgi:SAM-dependent methyltransferase
VKTKEATHTNRDSVRMKDTIISLRVAGLALIAALATCGASLLAQTKPSAKPDVIYVPTPQPVVDAMLDLAHVTAKDIVYDLGSGDGRIVITAARKYGAHGVGVEIDAALVKTAREHAAAAGVADRVRFLNQNLFNTDFSHASVVTLYLLQSINERLRPKLVRELKPGARIVSHVFNMGPEWPPEKTVTIDGSRIFLWSIARAVR